MRWAAQHMLRNHWRMLLRDAAPHHASFVAAATSRTLAHSHTHSHAAAAAARPASPTRSTKPWQWAAHLLGHEAEGSVCALLKAQGLVQHLEVGTGEEVRAAEGGGFMFWRVQVGWGLHGAAAGALLLLL